MPEEIIKSLPSLDVSVSEDEVKRLVKEFLNKNPNLVWGQKAAAYSLAYVMKEVLLLDPEDPSKIGFKDVAKFLSQTSLHGLAGNASQFKQWFFGNAQAVAKIDLDELQD